MRKKPSMVMAFACLAVILVCCCLAEPLTVLENREKPEPKSKPKSRPEPEPELKLGDICKYQMSFKGEVVGRHFMEEYGWPPCDFPEDPVVGEEYYHTINGTDIYQYVFTFRKPVASLCSLSEGEEPLFCGTRTVRKCGGEWALLDVYMADPWKYSLDLVWTKENRLVHLSAPDREILESPEVLRILKLVPYWTDCAENTLAEELAFNQNEDESHPSSRARAWQGF